MGSVIYNRDLLKIAQKELIKKLLFKNRIKFIYS